MNDQKCVSDKCMFELLSAYLDGEVTPNQRQEIQELLESDAHVQELYQRLQNLRTAFQEMPYPQSNCSSQQLSNQVFAYIDQERKTKKRWLWGSTAIATLLIAAIGNIFVDSKNSWQPVAQKQEQKLILAFDSLPGDIKLPKEESLILPITSSATEITK